MKHLFLSLFSLVCFSKIGLAQTTEKLERSIFFETNSAELTAESQTALADFAAELRARPDFEIDIEAYTDDQGSDGFNKKLAERRAASASDFLLKKQRAATPGPRSKVSANRANRQPTTPTTRAESTAGRSFGDGLSVRRPFGPF